MCKIYLIRLMAVVFLCSPLLHGLGKTPHRVPAASSKIRVDARLDEAAWQKALVLELNYEFLPGENIKPPVRTEVLLTYSRTHLYAAFHAYDPNPAAIRARLTDRDKYGGDDWIGLQLDTFNDNRRTYNFYSNPLGVQGDLIESPEGGGTEWDAIWDSAGRITAEGFIVEMAIPFSSLSFPHRKGDQVWGIEVVRSYPRNVRHLMGLFPRDRSNNCLMCQAEKIIGFTGATPGKNIELDPTLTSLLTQERENDTEGKFVEKGKKLDPGLTARWGFTPNLTLSAAVNPDFSNVEADAPQLDINTQFALYYSEKRPFFLEGVSLFSTRFQAVHTRTLADPDWGIKLTGKEGRHAIGFFTVQDSVTNLLFPGSQGSRSASLPIKCVGSVLRYRFDLGKSSTIGLLVTDREGSGYFNRLGGVDGDLRVTAKDRVRFQFLGSNTLYTPEITADYRQPENAFWGKALDIHYHHDTRSLDWYIGYRDVSKQFRADLGFMPQADFRRIDTGFSYTWQKPRGYWYTQIDIGSGYQAENNQEDNLLSKAFFLDVNYQGPLQSTFYLRGQIGKRTFAGMEFDDSKLFYLVNIRPSARFFLGLSGIYGDQVDFLNVQAVRQFQVEGYVEYKPGRHLSLQLDHIYEQLDLSSGAGRLYTANVSYLRMGYQFNRRTFLRVMLQYINYKYNTANYSFPIDPKYNHIFSQFLFSYKINPRTVLFLGYSDKYYGSQEFALTQTDRTFFLKIGYALVL